MVHVRRFTDSDTEALVVLLEDLGYPTTQPEVRERFTRMSSDHYHTLVAELDGAVVGFIGVLILPVYEYSEPVGWILALSVGSQHRQGGLGKALVLAAEQVCADQGATDVRLHSGLHRANAHGFYEALGYDKTGYRFGKHLDA